MNLDWICRIAQKTLKVFDIHSESIKMTLLMSSTVSNRLQDFSFIFIAHPMIVIGDVGKLCSDIGSSNVPESDCAYFAEMEGIPIDILPEPDEHSPPACFMRHHLTDNMTIFWNPDKTGMRNPEARPVCVSTLEPMSV